MALFISRDSEIIHSDMEALGVSGPGFLPYKAH